MTRAEVGIYTANAHNKLFRNYEKYIFVNMWYKCILRFTLILVCLIGLLNFLIFVKFSQMKS